MVPRMRNSIFAVGTFLLCLSSLASAQITEGPAHLPIAEFDASMSELELTPYLGVLKDPNGALTIEEISTAKSGMKFSSVSTSGNSFGFSKAAYWIRFSLSVRRDTRDNLLLHLAHPSTDRISLFIPDGQGGFRKRRAGESLPFADREIRHRSFLFRLPEQQGQTLSYYLRLQTEGSLQIALTLWSASAFIEQVNKSSFVLGIYYGIMLLLTFAALASYAEMRDRLFLYYALYLLSYLLLQLSVNGLSYQYFWPDLPNLSSRLTSASVGVAGFFGLLFSGSFLDVWRRHPTMKLLYLASMVAALTTTLMSLFGNYAIAVKSSSITGLVFPPIVLTAAIVSVVSGSVSARYFLAAWCSFLIGVFTTGLLYFGFVPHSFITAYAMQLTSTLEVVLLAYALMNRIDRLRKAKEEATLKANVYLKQLNDNLETLVAQRTAELVEKNEMLSDLVVRDSMTGLLNHHASVEYLRMARQAAADERGDLSVVMLDIDRFKAINDRHGHPAGDKVITAVTDLLLEMTRERQACGRYGGEEFVIILPETNKREARELAERIRERITTLRIAEVGDGPISASFGVAGFDPYHSDADLVSLADQALYDAKLSGRNRVEMSEEPGESSLLAQKTAG